MKKEKLKKISNDELEKLLDDAEWCDRDLLKEYDERKHNGRIIFKPIDSLEEYFRKRREEKEKKKAC